MARIIYIHTHSFGGERERKMWRFVRILCIWNQYANMLFMLRGVPSARNKEKGEIILYYGEIIFWLYYYGCGYFMKRRWIINCLTNLKGKRKQNGLSEKLIISHAVIRGLCNRVEGGREGSVKKGRLTLMVGDRWELGCLQGWQWLQRKRWACISSHRQCSQWEWRSSGALDLLEKGCQWAIRHSCMSPWHSCLLGSSGHRQQSGCCNATVSAQRRSCSQGLIWAGMWAGMAKSSHILSRAHAKRDQGQAEDDDIVSQRRNPWL